MRSLPLFTDTKRYRPLRLLGRGGMGEVYEVQDLQTGGRLALKVMLTQDARRLLRFKQEFRIVAELRHPSLVHRVLCTSLKLLSLCQRGATADVDEPLAELQGLLAEQPDNALQSICALAELLVRFSRGEFESALARGEDDTRAPPLVVRHTSLGYSLWAAMLLSPYLAILRSGVPLTRRRPTEARKRANKLAQIGLLDMPCLGYRALAYIESARGRDAASLRALRRALHLSSTNCNPLHRWYCLDTARDLGHATAEQVRECDRLRA